MDKRMRRYLMSADAVISLNEACDIYPGRREAIRQMLREQGVPRVDRLGNEVVRWSDVCRAMLLES